MEPMWGKEMAVRETFNPVDDKTQYMEMFEDCGGKETKLMDIKFTKK